MSQPTTPEGVNLTSVDLGRQYGGLRHDQLYAFFTGLKEGLENREDVKSNPAIAQQCEHMLIHLGFMMTHAYNAHTHEKNKLGSSLENERTVTFNVTPTNKLIWPDEE
ncbi:hypothetical protein A3C87_03035 [Candidatus Kaiserbacteria bacterium RIFCSPHIGHO2_02_FULL_49_34]|uniref:Uncharacterized protein n=1 Tax=Candidatus Kaiserbacteria bacterium RIFCSPHIGHO2_02_FULL_49_34 TaxID=1798491 RepID=A0A1F6DIE9_9BACT|nr:MAG: hypothetical protein A3C87_03035 [Candidatus Kaiserbacteria bacterium RIFCSPHIGHO2_02_FULL_49_34]